MASAPAAPVPLDPGRATAPAAPAPRRSRVDATAAGLMVGCCAVWGIGNVAAKAALPEVPPLWQVALRCGGAALLVVLWSAWRGVPLFRRDRTLAGGLLVGLLFGLEFLCIFWGLTFTTASRMVVFLYVSPFVVALGMPFIARHETLAPVQIGGLVLAFAGVAFAFAEGFFRPAAGDRQWIGDALGLAAGVLWGATTLAIRATRLSTASAEKTLAYQLAVAAALAVGERFPRDPSVFALGAVAFQTVVVTFASYLVWFWLVGRYPATQLSSFTLLTPVFGLVFGAWLLAEPVTARLLAGLGAVVAGIWLVSRGARRAPGPQPRQAG
jgi:drug/metabolite transporter (DMT)-like permease